LILYLIILGTGGRTFFIKGAKTNHVYQKSFKYILGMAIRIRDPESAGFSRIIRNPQFQCRIRIPIVFLNINIWILRYLFDVKMYVKCKGKFMEVKCFVICMDLLPPLKFFLFWNSNIYVIKIGIRIRRIRNPNPENPNPQWKKHAIESGIRIRRFFGRIAIPDIYENELFRVRNLKMNPQIFAIFKLE